ncbi:MAG: response regulator [Planctomycetes bacterium]|nr:response regulator [Planctomycetota bacterium]
MFPGSFRATSALDAERGGRFAMTATTIAPPRKRCSVLITDDDEGCRDSLRDALETQAFTTHVAGSGREAIYVVRTQVIHFAILDMHLPDLTGIETLMRIRQETRSVLLCIFISGEANGETRRRALAADEAFAFIPKPLDLHLVRRAVDDLVARYFRSFFV